MTTMELKPVYLRWNEGFGLWEGVCKDDADAVEFRRAPTPTLEGEREAIARIVDPETWIKVDGIISGERPVNLPSGWSREQYASSCYREEMVASLSKADQILARRVG